MAPSPNEADQKLSRSAPTALVIGSMVGYGAFASPALFGRATRALGATIAWIIAGADMLMLAPFFGHCPSQAGSRCRHLRDLDLKPCCCHSLAVWSYHERPDRLRRPDPWWIGGNDLTNDHVPGPVERQGHVGEGHRGIGAQQFYAQYQHEPDEASLLASPRRCASALWQSPRSHLGPGRSTDHFNPFELADR